jgi:uncharacterized membrane protein
LVRKQQPGATTVTVTRVTGAHVDEEGEAVPETVVVTTAEPAALQDTAAHKLARTALIVASVGVAMAAFTIAWRAMRHELAYHR